MASARHKKFATAERNFGDGHVDQSDETQGDGGAQVGPVVTEMMEKPAIE